jgi:serine/threonine protein phosphatase PrpC
MLRIAEQYAGTDTGLARRANEDSLLARAPLFVVADGMGGAQAGEVASRTAVECFSHALSDGEGDHERSLRERIAEANARIYQLSRSNADQAGMGTTLTALYVAEESVALAHVGDSRAYCLRDGRLSQLTEDHSLVDELIRQGRLTPAEAQDHPQRSVITRALGPEPTVEVDTATREARAGDVYLVCSDGLTTMVPEERLAEILLREPTLRAAGEAMLRAANEAGGRDNITVILVRLEEAPPGSAPAPLPAHENGADALAPATARRLRPRPAQQPRDVAAAGRRGGRLVRALVRPGTVVPLVLLGLVVAGAWLAIQSVYFLGVNGRGLVTVYSGLPYELPAGIKLYSPYYVSGVPAAQVPAARRRAVVDNTWRSHSRATQLVHSLELEGLGGE